MLTKIKLFPQIYSASKYTTGQGHKSFLPLSVSW